ncbi:MAG: hypothetical protein M3083_03620, partial [Actinomycetota bacterium]|nr:hypothetical protein [Actinomycetota bacterium]
VVAIDAVADAELVVNATPVGMVGPPGSGGLPLGPPDSGGLPLGPPGSGGLPLGLDPARLGPGQLVVDLIYAPPSTPLLDAARTAGAGLANGLGTLIHQAARQSRLWTGMDPPLAVMSAAALAALAAADHPAT